LYYNHHQVFFKAVLLAVLAFFFICTTAQSAVLTSTSTSIPSHNTFLMGSQGRALFSALGSSNASSFGADLMQPVYGQSNAFLFGNFMADYGTNDTYLLSPGGGYRQIIHNQIVGAYFFGDFEKVSLGQNFLVMSPGIEWMSPHWDAHINGYFPTNTQKPMGDSVFSDTLGDNSDVYFVEGTNNQYDSTQTPYDVIGNGGDVEVGYSFAGWNNFRSRVYLGSYFYVPPTPNVDNITGITGGFEQAISKNVTLGIINSYDQLNSYMVGVVLKISFGEGSTVFSNNVQDRLLDSIPRHVGVIATGAGTYDQEYTKYQQDVLEYDNVYFLAPNGTGDGTNGNAADLSQTTLDNIYADNPDGARIYLQSGGSDYVINSSDAQGGTLALNGLYVYPDQDFYGRTADYTAPASSDSQPIIHVDAVDYSAFIITEDGENTFSDLTIVGNPPPPGVGVSVGDLPATYGIFLDNQETGTNTLNVTNISISDLGDGVFVQNESTNTGDATLNISNSNFVDNLVAGFLINNEGTGTMAVNISGSQFSSNDVGLYVTNSGSGTINIQATSSAFDDNQPIFTGYGRPLEGAIFLNNTSNGQLNLFDLSNSSMSNNSGYGIYAAGSSTGTTTVNYTGASFSNNSTEDTNQDSSSYVIWTG